MQVGLGRPHCIKWGPSSPMRFTAPNFSACVRCGQTAGWIKMPLGIEVSLGSGDFMLDEDQAPPQKGGHSPQFSAHIYCDQTAGCIRIPLGTEVGLGPGDIIMRWGPMPPPKGALSQFSALSIVVKRSPISATAALLLYTCLMNHCLPLVS